MKRVASLLLFVSIVCAGCYEVEIDPFTGLPKYDKVREVAKKNEEPIKPTLIHGPSPGWQGEWDMYTELSHRIAKLESDLLKVEPMQIEEALLVRISDLEYALESQKEEIEVSKNVFHFYEIIMESQKLTIEILQKLCRVYETREQMNEQITANKVNPECR